MEKATDMEMEREEVEEEETESVSDVLRDRFRLSTISIAEAEGTFFHHFLSFLFFCLETEIQKCFVLFFSEKKWYGNIRTHCRLHFRFGLQICRFIYNSFYSRSYVIIAFYYLQHGNLLVH